LPDLWCFHLYSYEGELEVDGHVLPIKPGYVGINPPGSTMLYHYLGRSPHLFVHFLIPSTGPTYQVPAMKDLKEQYPEIVSQFREALRFWTVNRQRSVVRLWDILWQMADVSNSELGGADETPENIRHVVAYIDAHLHEPISIRRLAEEQGLSHNHFTRLFRASRGNTPMDYVQSRRAAQAKHLLVYSSLPIKSIASSIGITDPQIFNKFVKRYLGQSPRRVRGEEQPKIGLLD